MENNKDEEYQYGMICIQDDQGYLCELDIEELLNYNMGLCNTKEEKIEYLNEIIHDIEHYRDSLKKKE